MIFRHVFRPQVLFMIILGMRSRKTPLDYAWLRSWKPVQMRVLEFILLSAKRPLISRFPLVAAFGKYSLVSCISLIMTIIKLAINITWWHFVKESFVNIIIFKVKIEETVQLLTHPSYFFILIVLNLGGPHKKLKRIYNCVKLKLDQMNSKHLLTYMNFFSVNYII